MALTQLQVFSRLVIRTMEPAEKRKRTRAFQDSWKKGRPWLDYDHASLSMSCALCKTHFKRKTSGGGFGRDAWLKGKTPLFRIIGMLLGSTLAFNIRSINRLVSPTRTFGPRKASRRCSSFLPSNMLETTRTWRTSLTGDWPFACPLLNASETSAC